MKWISLAGLLASAIPVTAQAQDVAHPPIPRNRERWVQGDHYPAAALAVRAQGRVEFILMVDAKGRATDCRITRSSGDASLDATTCSLHTHGARFTPAVDAAGAPVAGEWAGKMNWILPG